MQNQQNKITSLPDNIKAFHYTFCGLDNIWLIKGVVINQDGSYSIPFLDELHDCIALTLVTKAQKLTGKEFRFIRKELGLTQKDISDEFGLDVQTVARWEKGETKGASFNPADRLIRMLFLLRKCGDSHTATMITKNLSLLEGNYKNKWLFEVSDDDWQFNRIKAA